MPLDLTITALNRVDGHVLTSLPGLMAATPPRKAARGRDQDRLIVYLLPAGKAVLSTGECVQSASRAAVAFYQTPGTITAALRSATESINSTLHDRNASSHVHGQYAVGSLALAAIREWHVTILLSGPMHAYVLGVNGAQQISDSLSGRGLGLSETASFYFSQVTLQPNDRLVLCSQEPSAWETALQDGSPASLEATRRRLMASTPEDVNGVLIQAAEGKGITVVQRAPAAADSIAPSVPVGTWDVHEGQQAFSAANERMPSASPPPESAAVVGSPPLRAPHDVGPSAYAIPPDRKDDIPAPEAHGLLKSDAGAAAPPAEPPPTESRQRQIGSHRTRIAARAVAGAMQAVRQSAERIVQELRRFLPRLLPGSEQSPWSFSSPAMMFIAVLVPLVVVTIASAVYFRYGRSVQYEQYLVQAQEARAQALSLTEAAAQREAWQRELFYLDKAETYDQSAETRKLRTEAQQSLDQLLGIVRLQFQPVLSTGIGAQIGRMSANENDLYLLDAQRGAILHIALLSGGFQVDSGFTCSPGSYGDYKVGPLVDLFALPPVNSMSATVMGVDGGGNLLYCAPGQVAHAIPLPPPDTNWGRVKAFTLDSGNLYVLDAQSHAVWVYVGKDGAFVDRPYFFFGGQIPALDDAIDLTVNRDDLYILHSDGHVSTCSYSHIDAVPTRCVDPAVLVNPLPAYRDLKLFSQAHFTEMMFAPAPDSALLLLDSDSQGVFQFEPRSLELQSQLRPMAGRGNPLPQGSVSAMAISSSHVWYFALQDRIYFASDVP